LERANRVARETDKFIAQDGDLENFEQQFALFHLLLGENGLRNLEICCFFT